MALDDFCGDDAVEVVEMLIERRREEEREGGN
jgi:hypothetical protein